jgi:hypothetical protein
MLPPQFPKKIRSPTAISVLLAKGEIAPHRARPVNCPALDKDYDRKLLTGIKAVRAMSSQRAIPDHRANVFCTCILWQEAGLDRRGLGGANARAQASITNHCILSMKEAYQAGMLVVTMRSRRKRQPTFFQTCEILGR